MKTEKQLQAVPFTYQGYLELLRRLSARGYSFHSFPEARELLDNKRQFVLMRHDVDLDLEKALALAELEASFGISATYFFMVRTHHYNVFSREGSEIVFRILELGHHFGLHFDCAAYPEDSSVDDLSQASIREAQMLQGWFGEPISIVSYHRPNALVLSGKLSLPAPLQHNYMPMFNQAMTYRSDSRREWKFGDPSQSAAFEQGKPLQILVHPVWWNEQPIAPLEALWDLLDRKMELLERSFADNCTIYRTGKSAREQLS